MAKGCGACGKQHAYSMVECLEGLTPAPPKDFSGSLTGAEGSLTPDSGSLTTHEGSLTEAIDAAPGSLTDGVGSLTKQQRYRQAHPDWYRTYQREYMRRRRGR